MTCHCYLVERVHGDGACIQSIKRPLPAIRPQESFDEFMKELVTRLVMEKSNNVIAYGYKTSAMESRSIFTTFHSSGNFILTHITSHNWSTIFLLLGPKISRAIS